MWCLTKSKESGQAIVVSICVRQETYALEGELDLAVLRDVKHTPLHKLPLLEHFGVVLDEEIAQVGNLHTRRHTARL